jgi:hypothetical protein
MHLLAIPGVAWVITQCDDAGALLMVVPVAPPALPIRALYDAGGQPLNPLFPRVDAAGRPLRGAK